MSDREFLSAGFSFEVPDVQNNEMTEAVTLSLDYTSDKTTFTENFFTTTLLVSEVNQHA